MTTEKLDTVLSFFARVEKAMKNRGISTLKELAEKVKISEATIQGWKKEGSRPQRRTLQALSETLNVESAWLLGASDTEPCWRADSTNKQTAYPQAVMVNIEFMLRQFEKHPEKERAIIWFSSMLLMIASGVSTSDNQGMERLASEILAKIFKSARGEVVLPDGQKK